MSEIASLRRQGETRDGWLVARLDTVVPRIMERVGIDCWVLVAREYNEDPVVTTMLPATWLSARRRTILVFSASGRKRAAISRYEVGTAFPAVWSPEEEPDQWERLARYLDDVSPESIAINRSSVFALADGMTAAEYDAFLGALPERLQDRVVTEPGLAIGWLETRSPDERAAYPDVCAQAHGILRRALSPEVITPGVTKPTDVDWWLREESRRLGYTNWFQPTTSVQRQGADEGDAIKAGDLVHIDFGIEYLGLHTDQQQHAYVLHSEEDRAPDGLRRGLAAANRMQDVVMSQFRTGRTGNDVLSAALAEAQREGMSAAVYSHPIGLHGHGAGPTIGLWDQQEGVAGAGDYPIWPDTAYSIELSVLVDVPEWGRQKVRIMVEEDAYFDGERIAFMDGRQTELWLI